MPERSEPSPPTASAPPVLSYSTAGNSGSSFKFFLGSIILALIFAVTFWIVENATSNLMLFHVQIRGPVQPGTHEWAKLEDHQFTDLVIEFFWLLPATAVMFMGLAVGGPRRGLRLSLRVIGAAVIGAVMYSWVRWALDFTPMHPSEGGDFCVAMVLAALSGITTSVVRSRSIPH